MCYGIILICRYILHVYVNYKAVSNNVLTSELDQWNHDDFKLNFSRRLVITDYAFFKSLFLIYMHKTGFG